MLLFFSRHHMFCNSNLMRSASETLVLVHTLEELEAVVTGIALSRDGCEMVVRGALI